MDSRFCSAGAELRFYSALSFSEIALLSIVPTHGTEKFQASFLRRQESSRSEFFIEAEAPGPLLSQEGGFERAVVFSEKWRDPAFTVSPAIKRVPSVSHAAAHHLRRHSEKISLMIRCVGPAVMRIIGNKRFSQPFHKLFPSGEHLPSIQ